MSGESLPRGRRQFHQHRNEQPLAFEGSCAQALRDPLEQHALVRDVLIDDRDALIVYGDDEGVAELAQWGERADARDWMMRGCGGVKVRRCVRRCDVRGNDCDTKPTRPTRLTGPTRLTRPT